MDAKLLNKLRSLNVSDVRDLYVARVKIENENIADARRWIVEKLGFQEIDSNTTVLLAGEDMYTEDGRAVMRAHGKLWATSKENRDKMISDAIKNFPAADEQKKNDAGSMSICPCIFDGILCGGTIRRVSVCKKSSLGRAGVVAVSTCDVCGNSFAVIGGA